ncbi:MAG: cupin domain-containing protein [Acidobacteriota bacterium]|nr:cupin domain-containing protein [Acidobacteriota bacterium]
MNRREFAAFAALAPLTISAAEVKGARPDKPSIFLPENARVHDIGRGEARILVGGEQSGGAWWLGSFRNDPGRQTSLHVHHSADEQFYALEGVISVWVDGSWHDLVPGALAVVPSGTPHALWNRSEQPVRFLNSGNPAGFEKFFADIETILAKSPSGSPEFFAEVMKVYKNYDTTMLGPAPKA